jgi:hypothetical protein
MTATNLPLGASLPAALQSAVAKYDAWSHQHLLDEQAKTVVGTPLYQYTNASGLKGIFDSRQMWFTDYRFLNDPSEFGHGMDMAKEMLRDAKTGADGRAGLFLDCVADLFSQDNVDATLAFFVASFSRARDDLGQWRSYGDNGRGFSVGFAPKMFRIQDEANPSPDENSYLGPVLYKMSDVLSRHRLAIDQATGVFLTAVETEAELMRDVAIGYPFMLELAKHIIAAPLIWNALTSKHPAYEHEQEVRLVMVGTSDKLAPFVKTRARGSDLVPYIPHPWDVREPRAIVEILVGPAAPPGAEEAVKALLAGYGITGIKIERSDIPYRVT